MGGADKQLLSAAEEMHRRGHEILIVSLTPLGPMGLEARHLGIPTESLNMRRGLPDPRGMVRLVRLVRAWKPDVLHSHLVHANLMARALRLFVRLPVLVSTLHSVYDEGGPLLMLAYRLTNRLVDLMTIVSETAANGFVAKGTIPRELLRVIPNGVDLDRFHNVAPSARQAIRGTVGLGDQFVWLAVGRFETAKDYPNLLRAFADVHRENPGSVLVLVGRGELQAETEALSQDLGLTACVRFLGVRHDVPELMSAADGYVLSSAWEGMPVVLLEAAASGLPVVATDVGGIREVVRDQESGFLVPRRDPASLALAMLRLMGLSAAERSQMGERGQAHVRAHYGLGRVVNGWEDVYREVQTRKRLISTAVTVP
jgi:glycosyltransferase involved in cell wall biosynthesis